jgi:fibronectin-binding autotransporter adhesin
VLSDNPNNYVDSANGSTLTIAAGHVVKGSGHLGGYWGSSLNIVNQGTIVSDAGNGLMFYGNVLDNTAGLIDITQGSFFNAASGTVSGGVIRGHGIEALYGTNFQNLTVQGGLMLNTGTFTNVVFKDTNTITNGNVITMAGTTTVDGSLVLGTQGSYGVINLTGNTTLTGTGQTVLSDNPNNYIDSANGSTLTIAAGHVVKGSGHLGGYWSTTLKVLNQGRIEASGANPLYAYTDSSDGFINQGFVQVNAGNTMIFQGGARLVQDREAAITTVNGELYSSVLDLRAGVLSGRGTITGNVVNAGGTVAPGTSPGTLSVLGDYTQGAAGNLLIEIDGFDQGLSYDWLSILGDANLAGNLYLDIGFHPADGSTFTFLTTTNGAVTGSFEHVYAAGWNVETTYTLNSVSVTLTATAVPEPQAFALLMAGLLVVGAGLRSRQHRTQR